MSDKKTFYDIVKDFVLPLISVGAAVYIGTSAQNIAKETQKVSQNSSVLRYQIHLSEKDGEKKVTIEPTAGFLRKVAYIKFSNGVIEYVDVEDGTYTEPKTQGKVLAETTIPDSMLAEKDDKKYIFVVSEGGNGVRNLDMIVFQEGEEPQRYDSLEVLKANDNSTNSEFRDFKDLRDKMLQDKLLSN